MDPVTPSSPRHDHDATTEGKVEAPTETHKAPQSGSVRDGANAATVPPGAHPIGEVAEFLATAAASGIIGNLAYDAIKPAVADFVRRQRFFTRRKQKTRLEAIAREAVVRRCSDVGVPSFDIDSAHYYHRRTSKYRHVQIRTASGETAEVRIPDDLAAKDVADKKVKVTLYTRAKT